MMVSGCVRTYCISSSSWFPDSSIFSGFSLIFLVSSQYTLEEPIIDLVLIRLLSPRHCPVIAIHSMMVAIVTIIHWIEMLVIGPIAGDGVMVAFHRDGARVVSPITVNHADGERSPSGLLNSPIAAPLFAVHVNRSLEELLSFLEDRMMDEGELIIGYKFTVILSSAERTTSFQYAFKLVWIRINGDDVGGSEEGVDLV